jgi:hypothetical protein
VQTVGRDEKVVTICLTRSSAPPASIEAMAQAFAARPGPAAVPAETGDECLQSHFSEFFEKPLSAGFTESFHLDAYNLPCRALVPLMTVEGFSR